MGGRIKCQQRHNAEQNGKDECPSVEDVCCRCVRDEDVADPVQRRSAGDGADVRWYMVSREGLPRRGVAEVRHAQLAVQVAVLPVNTAVVVTVHAYGTSIPPATAARAFNLTFRLDGKAVCLKQLVQGVRVVDIEASCDGVCEGDVGRVVEHDGHGARGPVPAACGGVKAVMDLLHVFDIPLIGGVVVEVAG